MADTVTIHTINPHPRYGIAGEVYVNRKHILTIHPNGLDNHVGKWVTFSVDTMNELDKQVKAWINDNLRKNPESE